MTAHLVLSEDRKHRPEIFERVLGDSDLTIEHAELNTKEQLRDLGEVDILVSHSRMPLSGEILRQLDGLEAIFQVSIGIDNIDVETARELDISVVHALNYCRDEVATHALSLLLACLRKVVTYHQAVEDGTWSSYETGQPIHRLAGETVGIIAFGPIARRFAHRLEGFDTDVVAYDPYVDQGVMADHGVRKVSLMELAEEATHVSSHAPITGETRGMLDREFFRTLDDEAVVVNTGRGGVIDEAALSDALEAGEISAAGIDVFDEEPPWGSPLLDRDDVVVTPHAGWYSEESIDDANESIATDIARYLDGEEPEGLVDPAELWVE